MAATSSSPAPSTPASSTPASSSNYASSDYASSSDYELTFALTTLFTPPSDCRLPILTSSGTYINYWIPGSDGGTTTFFGSARSCYPTQFYLSGAALPLYSPGACPTGFNIVAASTPLSPAVTFATCCPSDAMLYSGYFCTASPINEVTTINDGQSTILGGKYIFEYPPITVAWESADLARFSPSAAPLLAYQSAVATGVSVGSTPTNKPGATATRHGPAATASTTKQSSTDDKSLSTGAKAGIGVGIGVAVLAAIGLLVWILLRRRKKRQSWPSPAAPSTAQNSAAPAYEERREKRGNASDTTWYTYERPQELDARQSPWTRSELSSENIRGELASSDSVRR